MIVPKCPLFRDPTVLYHVYTVYTPFIVVSYLVPVNAPSYPLLSQHAHAHAHMYTRVCTQAKADRTRKQGYCVRHGPYPGRPHRLQQCLICHSDIQVRRRRQPLSSVKHLTAALPNDPFLSLSLSLLQERLDISEGFWVLNAHSVLCPVFGEVSGPLL